MIHQSQDGAALALAFGWGGRGSLRLLELPHYPHQFVEALVHVYAHLRGALDVRNLQLSGQALCLLCGHLPLRREVRLVGHHQHGEHVPVLDAQDLLVEARQLGEGRAVRQREHQQEALAGPHVLLPHGRELLLTRRVQDVELGHDVIDDALLGVRVLDGGVIVSGEVALDKLYCDSRFAHATSAHYNNFGGLKTWRLFIFCTFFPHFQNR